MNSRLNNISGGDGGSGAEIVDVTWNDSTCMLIFQHEDGTETEINIPLIETFSSLYYDEANKDLVLVLPDASEQRISIENLITIYNGSDSEHISVTIENGVIRAEIIPGSLTGGELIESIALRGSPTATTQLISDNSNKLATTKFVHDVVVDNLISYDTSRPLSANMGRILNQNKVDLEDVLAIIADTPLVNVVDNLISTDRYSALSANMGRELNLTKAPLVHTSPSSSTFGRATVSLFGHARASDVDPLMDGAAFIGTDDGYYARADHRHPTDTTRMPLDWSENPDIPPISGGQAESPDPDSNDLSIANTEWVIAYCVDTITDEHINDAVDRALEIVYGEA